MLASDLQECYFMPMFRDDGQVGYKHSTGYYGVVITRDDAEINRILDRFFTIKETVERMGHPEPDYNPSSRECSYCDYWDYCWGAQGFKRYRKVD
jgi:CRISPR/Cas system-associated exonuclease Cas4 (RecB family)